MKCPICKENITLEQSQINEVDEGGKAVKYHFKCYFKKHGKKREK